MAENKTKPSEITTEAFIESILDPVRREDARTLSTLFERVTGSLPMMWGPSIVGFRSYRYRYASGHQGTACRTGFSPRKAELVLYVGAGRPEQAAHLARLGKHRTGKSCLYIKRLSDIDADALEAIVRIANSSEPEGYVPA
ncbi:MAG: DUF1801 domain-containing protein [Sphingomonadales bacterium]